ncbi:PQQ-binding-like beta-propeller repeat protein [Halorubrum sp. F4]|uniref:outer membrane protein assembly factor BamB family protein n=1 Tax=Halorubrum sp. F4 TaxID=2989715 RepID=UPI002480C43A|nr:PQQ-binding-like beta-propeller repeat protein [Halorubrum sp. F4]
MGIFSRRSVLEALAGTVAISTVGGVRGESATAAVDRTSFASVGERDRGVWGTYHGNRRRTGFVPDGLGPETNPRIEWLFETGFTGGGGALRQQHPIVRDGTAYALTETPSETTADSGDVRLAAIDLETKSESWRASPEINGVSGPLATDDRSIYLNAPNGVLSLDRTDGSVRWIQDDFFPTGGPVSVGDEVYSIVEDRSTEAGLLVALDADSGERVWEQQIGEVRSAASPAYADGTVYAATGRGGRLYAIDATSRSEAWVFEIDGDHDFQGSVPAIAPGEAYVASQERLFSIDTATGEERWSVESGNSWNAPAVTDAYVLHSNTQGVTAYERESGSEAWQTRRPTGPESSPIVIGDTAYLYDGFSGEVGAVALDTGERRWTFPLGGHEYRADLAFHDGRLFVNVSGRVFVIASGDATATPTAAATHAPDRPGTGREVTFDASDSDGEIDRYLWNFSGDLFETGEEATHTYEYDAEGNRQYSLLVIDRNGRTDAVYGEALAPEVTFDVAITETNAPIDAGGDLVVSFDVTNDGDAEADRTVNASVDGLGSETIGTRLEPDETSTETVTFATGPENVGTFDVVIDSGTDGDSTTVTLADPTDEADGGQTDGTDESGSGGGDTAVDGGAGTAISSLDESYLLGGAGALTVLAAGGVLFRRSRRRNAGSSDIGGIGDDGGSAGDSGPPANSGPAATAGPNSATDDSGSNAGDGSTSGGSIDSDRAEGTPSDPGSATDPDVPPDSAEAIRTGIDEATNAAENAREDGYFDAAAERYERTLRTYEDAVERLDGSDAAELAAVLDDVRSELHAVRTCRRDRESIHETLRSAEKGFQEAIDAHLDGRSTLSKLRYRQARDRFDSALEAMDDAHTDVLSPPLEVLVEDEREVAGVPLADLPWTSDAAAETLIEAGFETVSDLYAADPVAVDDAASGGLPDALDTLRDAGHVDASAVSRLTALSWCSAGDEIAFGERSEIERRRKQAAAGFDATR